MDGIRIGTAAGRPLRTRAAAAGAALLTVAAGLAVRSVVGGEFAARSGTALYTVLVYTLVVVAAPRARPVMVAGVALGVSWAVEFLQLSGVPAELSARSWPARMVLGSTFDPADLPWYAVGAALGWLAHVAVRAIGGLARDR
ncbi:DUF2809 domain-containing protein [Peterkaempfera bronchialis]|uniref:ribosomal maturation YjgA family protein n=1 Tax=Peterkaempfera bronchialis TaxID=2126346 RepID=UPI003C2EC40E